MSLNMEMIQYQKQFLDFLDYDAFDTRIKINVFHSNHFLKKLKLAIKPFMEEIKPVDSILSGFS